MALEAEELSTNALDTAKNARNTLRETQVNINYNFLNPTYSVTGSVNVVAG